jgi:hypothetical protein
MAARASRAPAAARSASCGRRGRFGSKLCRAVGWGGVGKGGRGGGGGVVGYALRPTAGAAGVALWRASAWSRRQPRPPARLLIVMHALHRATCVYHAVRKRQRSYAAGSGQRAAQHLRAIVGCGSRAPRKCCGICPVVVTSVAALMRRPIPPASSHRCACSLSPMPPRHGSAHCGCGRTASRSLAACDPRSSVRQRVRARRMGAAALMARPDRSGRAPLRPTRAL